MGTSQFRWRWYQFSIRGLLLVSLVASICFACLAWWYEQVRQRQRFETAIRLIEECPHPDGYGYNPVSLIRAVNYLRSIGKQEALIVLDRFEAGRSTTESYRKLQFIVPLLFEQPEDGKFPSRSDDIGGYELDSTGWTDFRIELIDDIPFHTRCPVLNSGQSPSLTYLVRWAAEHGRLRIKPLRPADNICAAADRAFQRLSQLIDKDFQTQLTTQFHIRKQVFDAVEAFNWPGDYRNAPWHSPDDDGWNQLRDKCQQIGVHWSEARQEYVAMNPPGKIGP